jgi:hypothetical protein
MTTVEKHPLNIETLINLGITPSILKHHFEEWVSNPDYVVDFDNDLIYTGISSSKKELKKLEKEILNSGLEVEIHNIQEEIKKRLDLKENLSPSQNKNLDTKFIDKNVELYQVTKQERDDAFISFLTNTDFLVKDKEIEKEKSPGIYHNIFIEKRAFPLFEDFIKGCGDPGFSDYSFIFQQLLKDEFIIDMKHNRFMNWLKKNEYINDKEYDYFKLEGAFRGLSKTANYNNRLKRYTDLAKEYSLIT